MKGRKPKPSRVKVTEGNPGCRPINRREPQPLIPTVLFDEPPPDLAENPIAQEEWKRLAPILRRARVVTEGDRTALLALCQQWAIYLDALSKVRGLVVTTKRGVPIPNPYLTLAGKSLTLCIRLWAELGCTPSARSRVVTTSETGGDALTAALDPDGTLDSDAYGVN